MNIVATGLPATIEDYQVALNAAFAGGEAFGKAQQRTWVGLTDRDIEAIWGEDVSLMYSGHYDAIRVIEAKLKEKNT